MRAESEKPPVRSDAFRYPVDRFDQPSHGKRVGAHRISGKSFSSRMFIFAGFIATVLLVAIGMFWVNTVGGSGNAQEAAPEVPAPAAVEAVIDPTATIAILNGTPLSSLQATVENVITAGGLGQVVFREYAADREVGISAVFYQAPEDEPAARALAAQLGGVSTYQSDDYADFGVRLTVLLGQDYAGPGLAEAQAEQALIDQGVGIEPVAVPDQTDVVTDEVTDEVIN